jgi:hypothetical protein
MIDFHLSHFEQTRFLLTLVLLTRSPSNAEASGVHSCDVRIFQLEKKKKKKKIKIHFPQRKQRHETQTKSTFFKGGNVGFNVAYLPSFSQSHFLTSFEFFVGSRKKKEKKCFCARECDAPRSRSCLILLTIVVHLCCVA